MFRKPVKTAKQGDRVGICVAQLDATTIERGIACAPGSMGSCDTVIAAIEKVKFFTDIIKTKSKFHITLGHQTAVGLVHLFSTPLVDGCKFEFSKSNLISSSKNEPSMSFDFKQ